MAIRVEETAQIQAPDRIHQMLPVRAGQIERRTHPYVRHGTAGLLDAKTGKIIGQCAHRHRSMETVQPLDTVDNVVPLETARCLLHSSLPSTLRVSISSRVHDIVRIKHSLHPA